MVSVDATVASFHAIVERESEDLRGVLEPHQVVQLLLELRHLRVRQLTPDAPAKVHGVIVVVVGLVALDAGDAEVDLTG